MFRRLSTGEVVDPTWTLFAFPTMWHYDVLRGLDYLRSAGVKPEERAGEAVEIVARGRREKSRWPLDLLHADRLGFDSTSRRATPAVGIRYAPCAC